MNFSDNEYKLHKQLCINIIENLKPIRERLEKIISKQYEKLSQLYNDISKQEDVLVINSLSEEVENLKKDFVKNLALKTAIENLITKNEDRIEFINKYFNKVGIYNEKVDKKELKTQILQIEKNELDLDTKFINPRFNLNYFIFYKGLTFEICDGKFDFKSEHNKSMLENNLDLALKFAFNYHPNSIATINVDILTDVEKKKKFLKQIAYFASDKILKMSIKDIDSMLGGILNFSYGVPGSLKSYILEVENAFNVKIKNYLSKEGNLSEQELTTLICDEKSKFLIKS